MNAERSVGRLTLICGKMGAGKSTRARAVAKETNAVLLSEDEWLAALYPGEIVSLADYARLSARLKLPIKPLVHAVLAAGADVVMDFPANTKAQRAWLRSLSADTGAAHVLHFLDVSDAVCLERIAQRRQEQPERSATDTEEMFHRVTRYFEPPTSEEGFRIEHDRLA